ncbi:MAG: ABC transporter ATP-binding protein [bacterium]
MIKLQKVSKIYKRDKIEIYALNNVSLEIKKGEFCAIIGHSGSGKSTLMNIIGCLDRPTAGNYLLEDKEVGKKSDKELAYLRNQMIGFVFQNFYLLPRFDCLKNVTIPLFYGRMDKGDRMIRARSLLQEIGLGDRLLHRPSELSGGQMQRVAIARALANKPKIICADEPTGNLDSKTGLEIMNVFKRLNKEGVTIILVTHEQEFASFAERIIRLKDGKIEEEIVK